MDVNGMTAEDAARLLYTIADELEMYGEIDCSHENVESRLKDAADLLRKQERALTELATGRGY